MARKNAVLRYWSGSFICGIGIVLFFCGMFSAKADVRAGLFGISAVFLMEAGIVSMIAGLIILPSRKMRAAIISGRGKEKS